MIKIFSALLSVFIILGSGLSLAQSVGALKLTPAEIERAAKEAPLRQADIDAFIKIMPRMNELANGKTTFKKLGQASGLGEVRLSLTVMKVIQAQALNAGVPYDQIKAGVGLESIPEPFQPSKAEIDLVRRNSAKLDKARQAAR